MNVIKAEVPKNPKAVIELDPVGLKIHLENWVGVSAVMLERMYFELIKAVQRHRAESLRVLERAERSQNLAKEQQHVA